MNSDSAYRIVKAPHDPLIPLGLFELAQAVRKEKALASPNRVGRPRSYGKNQGDRVFPLQGRFFCAECGHSMTPHYVFHKPNLKEKRVNPCYVHPYICAQYQEHRRKGAGHSNRVLASISESWIKEQLKNLVTVEGLIENAVEMARGKCSSDLEPQQRALELNRHAMKENQSKIDRLIESITSREVAGSFLSMLNSKATEFNASRSSLKSSAVDLSKP